MPRLSKEMLNPLCFRNFKTVILITLILESSQYILCKVRSLKRTICDWVTVILCQISGSRGSSKFYTVLYANEFCPTLWNTVKSQIIQPRLLLILRGVRLRARFYFVNWKKLLRVRRLIKRGYYLWVYGKRTANPK